jgi:cytoskeletal protein CcmA (bactofilin family)
MPDRPTPATSESTTVIGKGIHIRGRLTGSAPIEIWGSLEGVTGTEGSFRVREGGRVDGEIAAAEVVVEGRVEGKISAEHRVELRPTARVQGDVVAKKVAIAEGAVFDGRIRMSSEQKGSGGGSAPS